MKNFLGIGILCILNGMFLSIAFRALAECCPDQGVKYLDIDTQHSVNYVTCAGDPCYLWEIVVTARNVCDVSGSATGQKCVDDMLNSWTQTKYEYECVGEGEDEECKQKSSDEINSGYWKKAVGC